MRSSPPLVAVDACALIEAVLFRGSDYPSARILLAAQNHAFRLMLIEAVETEARRALASAGLEAQLDAALASCLALRRANATPGQLRLRKRRIWAVIRDEPDAEIGVAVRCARPRPVIFVSSNKADWRPSPAAREAMGGCEIMRSRQFANLIQPR